MDTYGVVRYRAVATSAVREAQNRDAFLDRVRLRTGIDVEVIDGSEENRLTYMAVREALRDHEALVAGDALLVEVGGGSADISFLRKGQPIHSGTYALGSIRMRQSLASWQGSHEQGMRLLRRHIHNVVDDIRREMPLREARHFIALGRRRALRGDADRGPRHAGARRPARGQGALPGLLRRSVMAYDVEQLVERYRLPTGGGGDAGARAARLPRAAARDAGGRGRRARRVLRGGLLLDMVRGEEAQGIEDFRRQVLASAAALGEKYRYDAPHAQAGGRTSRCGSSTSCKSEHGLSDRDRLLLEVAALLHDIGNYVNLRGHHKHTQYLLSVSEIFGLSHDDMAIVANVARYHRRATPRSRTCPTWPSTATRA